jgi:integrase/recombinase XerC
MVELFFKYLSLEKRYSKHTLTSYRTDLTQFQLFLEGEFGSLPVEEVNYNILRSFVLSLMEEGNLARTVNRKIACLKSFYKFLKREGKVELDPTIRLKGPKAAKKLPDFVSEKDLISLFDRLQFEDTFEGKRDEMILEFFYGTGTRLSELIEMKDRDIDKTKGQVKVLGKGNKHRIIPLNAELIRKMEVYSRIKKEAFPNNTPSHFIVLNNGDITYPMFIYRKVKSYLETVTTLSKKSPHVLRHTFATHLLDKGADLNAIKELLGHSSLAATQVYTHNSVEKLKEVFNQAHPRA